MLTRIFPSLKCHARFYLAHILSRKYNFLMTSKKAKNLVDSFLVGIGIVLIWRGVWHLLDLVDHHFLNGDHLITAIAGIIVGTLILYIPDKDLKELGKL